MSRHLLLAAVACATAAAAPAAPAAPAAGPLEVTSRVLVEAKTRAADGTTRIALVPVRRAVPGDRVTVVLDYRNTGRQPLADVAFDNPVPGGLAYRAPADGSPAPEVSLDGRSFGPLRDASPAAVTHVRWRLGRAIPAGGSGRLAFQAVLK